MKTEDILEIIIPTFNRKKYLKNTLDSLLSEKSPVKNVQITVLDNASFDGTSEMIDEYAAIHVNIKHIKNARNVGGDVNICNAYSLAKKEYAWVLCDDDSYDWASWNEAEQLMEKKTPVIYVGALENIGHHNFDYPFFLNAMSFVPVTIFRSELITDDLLVSMYKTTYTQMQQLRLAVKCANNRIKIEKLSKEIVRGGQAEMKNNHKTGNIMLRGVKEISDAANIMKKQPFVMPGIVIALQDVEDPEIREKAMRIAMRDYPGDMILEFIKYFASKTELLNIAASMFMCLSPEQQRRLHKIRKMIFGLYMVDSKDKKCLFVNFLGKYRRKIWTFKNKSNN